MFYENFTKYYSADGIKFLSLGDPTPNGAPPSANKMFHKTFRICHDAVVKYKPFVCKYPSWVIMIF